MFEVVNDSISKELMLKQLDFMIDQKKFLIGKSVQANSQIGIGYDSGYLVALLDIRSFVMKDHTKEEAELEEDDAEADNNL